MIMIIMMVETMIMVIIMVITIVMMMMPFMMMMMMNHDSDNDHMIRLVPRFPLCRFIASQLGTAISTQDSCYSTDPLYWD